MIVEALLPRPGFPTPGAMAKRSRGMVGELYNQVDNLFLGNFNVVRAQILRSGKNVKAAEIDG